MPVADLHAHNSQQSQVLFSYTVNDDLNWKCVILMC
ncbi:unnamed protein product [Anisakis simplex]|uniref:Histone deacetylase n=1 Tax=Anisakis simplex TaxID=6269 RepID=A0A0M3JA04_ANISI|nr:unnamed protein product [Anisakis simplex]